jgi:OmpA-OmpF porin, OOP family
MKWFLFFALFPLSLFTTVTQSAKAQNVNVLVSVTDYKNNPSQGEQILFVSKKTGETYSGVSDSNGKFSIEIPGADSYQIKIKGVGEDQDYYTMDIPALNENQSYGLYELEIKFEPPRVFTLENVLFDTGKAVIRSSSNTELKELFDYLSLKTDIRVEIAGHTDDVGEADDNLLLSQNRANAVKNWLVQRGIDKDRIIAKGYGETKPVASNTTEAGKQKNRRTEVRILEE